ncbi:MAG: hypothetical protein HW391_2018 [Chloroflexi bacterium]|nr:hypothetical protein [Chloroflexota bacterium]
MSGSPGPSDWHEKRVLARGAVVASDAAPAGGSRGEPLPRIEPALAYGMRSISTPSAS